MKQDNQKYFTKEDGEELKKDLKKELTEVIDIKLDNKLGELEEKLFKWKSEIFDAVDSVAREMNTNQEFREIIGNQIEEQGAKIMKLEKKVFGSASV